MPTEKKPHTVSRVGLFLGGRWVTGGNLGSLLFLPAGNVIEDYMPMSIPPMSSPPICPDTMNTVTITATADGVSVLDDGPGFPSDLVAHAFERFARAGDGRSRATGSGDGAGLGLALVEAIVSAHGGRDCTAVIPVEGIGIQQRRAADDGVSVK